MRSLIRIVIVLALYIGAKCDAQTWYKIANEGDSINLGSNGITIRYGSPNCTVSATVICWTQLSASGSFIANNSLFKLDPAPNIVKEVDILETNSIQTILVNGKPQQIPAQPVIIVTPPPTTKTVIGTRVCSNYTETYYSDGSEQITATCTTTGVAQ